MKVWCGHCGTAFEVQMNNLPTTQILCTSCGHLSEAICGQETGQSATKILVAHEEGDLSAKIRQVILDNGYEPLMAKDMDSAMELLRAYRPPLAVVDVALPGSIGFRLCEKVRADPLIRNIKIILVASIYSRTSYKRKPTSLYGADDYIEQHHIPDSLVAKIRRLLFPPFQVGALPLHSLGSLGKDFRQLSEEVRQMSLSRMNEEALAERREEERAIRLARIIVADIALYNEDKITEGLQQGDLYERLGPEIAEGRALYSSRVLSSPRNRDLFGEIVEEMIAARLQIMNSGRP